jgi:hypothetical protein
MAQQSDSRLGHGQDRMIFGGFAPVVTLAG